MHVPGGHLGHMTLALIGNAVPQKMLQKMVI